MRRFFPTRPGRKPDVVQLTQSEYTCRSCAQPYRLKADGRDYRVFGNTRYETLKVVVVDELTIVRTGKRAGVAVEESTVTVSPDGARMTEPQILTFAGGHKLDFTNQLARVSPGSKGSHAISGTWRMIESDLTNHDQDTTYKTTGDTLSMSDRMGRSFSARLDGTAAPYKGSAAFTTVSVKQIDNHTIEETDKKGTQIVRETCRIQATASSPTVAMR